MTATTLALGGAVSGPAEVYPFRLELTTCAPDGFGEGSVPLGSAIVLNGRTRQPVEVRDGVRHWFAPPVAGGLPGVPGGAAGVFTFDGLPGDYSRIVERTNTVRLELPGLFTAELDRPDPDADRSDGFTTVWTATRAAVPVGARLLDEDQETKLQYRLVAVMHRLVSMHAESADAYPGGGCGGRLVVERGVAGAGGYQWVSGGELG